MLQPVWPSLSFWNYLGLLSSFAWLLSALNMNFLNKTTHLVTFLRVTIYFLWFVVNVLLDKVFTFLLANPQVDSLFGGYERAGKMVGYALLSFGNIGLYYYSEKSIACMLTFLFLALHCHCALFCIQPYTDFGILGFILSASLNRALTLFGLHMNSWIVVISCIIIVELRYWLEPVPPPPIIPNLSSSSSSSSSSLEIQQVHQPPPILNNIPSSLEEEEEPLIRQVEQHLISIANLPSSLEEEEDIEMLQGEQPPSIPNPNVRSLKRLSNLLSLKELNNLLSLIE